MGVFRKVRLLATERRPIAQITVNFPECLTYLSSENNNVNIHWLAIKPNKNSEMPTTKAAFCDPEFGVMSFTVSNVARLNYGVPIRFSRY